MDFRILAREERADLAAFLRSLSPEQWKAPTLCTEWRVRDVVSHMLSYDELGRGALMRRFAKGRFWLVAELSGPGQPKLAHRMDRMRARAL